MLKIEVAENGFIVMDAGREVGLIGKQYAFETSESLAQFIAEWGREEEKEREADRG